MTDFQRLRRNVLREIHDYSAPHRMLVFPAAVGKTAAVQPGHTGANCVNREDHGHKVLYHVLRTCVKAGHEYGRNLAATPFVAIDSL